MLTFDDETGNVLIEFSDELTVTLRPPKYGALKRLRHERERLNEEAHARQAALPEIPEAGADDRDPETGVEARARLGRERLAQVQEINLDAMEAFWRFLMRGDDTFSGLADPLPPADSDEWPGELMLDARAPYRDPQGNLTIDAPIADRLFNHWGKVRLRSGPKA